MKAILLCSSLTREYLVNYARPLIYSTAMSFPSLAAIKVVYSLMQQGLTQPVSLPPLLRMLSHLTNPAHLSPRRAHRTSLHPAQNLSTTREAPTLWDPPPSNPSLDTAISHICPPDPRTKESGEMVSRWRFCSSANRPADGAGRDAKSEGVFACRE